MGDGYRPGSADRRILGVAFEGKGREALMDSLLYHTASPALIGAFFEPTRAFEGDLIHTIRQNDPHRITVEDLFAVTMLDVAVGPLGVRRLLYDEQTRDVVNALLKIIPNDVDIWNGKEHIELGGPADQLLNLLPRQGDRIGPTTAAKIVARKRPRLIPIVDSVVVAILQAPSRDMWRIFYQYLQSAERRERLGAMRPHVVSSTVPLLRMLDVLLWMWGSHARVTRRARTDLGLPAAGWPALPTL